MGKSAKPVNVAPGRRPEPKYANKAEAEHGKEPLAKAKHFLEEMHNAQSGESPRKYGVKL